jgi:hypothetical protein
MEVVIRDYSSKDFPGVVRVLKEAHDGLRQSRGGLHPDKAMDMLVAGTDAQIFSRIVGDAELIVAEDKETGRILGIGGLSQAWTDRLLGSAYSTAHFVSPDFQRGKAGVGVGTLLRKATFELAAKKGCRKIYGFATPESIGFHERFGAKFYPRENYVYVMGQVPLHYYEIILKPSMWNGLRLEPLLFKLSKSLVWLTVIRILIFGAPKAAK